MNRLPNTSTHMLQFDMTAALGSNAMLAAQQCLSVLTLPFDTARFQYAHSVQAGLLPKSMLASREFERTLAALERFTLGPLARHV